MANTPVALVTGSARRVGAAIVRALHARGLACAVHYRDSASAATELVAALNGEREGSAAAFQAELGDVDACRALIESVCSTLGGLDVLVNNASSFFATPIRDVTCEQWDALVDSNLKGPLFLASAAADALTDRAGCIVNITDIHAQHPLRDHAVYGAAKGGLEVLTRALARDLAPRVRVNAVAPGAILWPERAQPDAAAERRRERAIIAATELRRIGTPSDVAGAVCYLALDAPYVTGQTLVVDGGRTIGP